MLAEVPAPMWNEPVDEEDALDAQPQLALANLVAAEPALGLP